jgi:hypothetical protein
MSSGVKSEDDSPHRKKLLKSPAKCKMELSAAREKMIRFESEELDQVLAI